LAPQNECNPMRMQILTWVRLQRFDWQCAETA